MSRWINLAITLDWTTASLSNQHDGRLRLSHCSAKLFAGPAGLAGRVRVCYGELRSNRPSEQNMEMKIIFLQCWLNILPHHPKNFILKSFLLSVYGVNCDNEAPNLTFAILQKAWTPCWARLDRCRSTLPLAGQFIAGVYSVQAKTWHDDEHRELYFASSTAEYQTSQCRVGAEFSGTMAESLHKFTTAHIVPLYICILWWYYLEFHWLRGISLSSLRSQRNMTNITNITTYQKTKAALRVS